MITHAKEPYTAEEVEKILHPIVKKWFFSKFKSFSLPQLYGVMEIHKRNNILISAPTGATKTLTSFLSIINELVDSSEKGILKDKIYAVYISPLKALNYDIEKNLKEPLMEIEDIAGRGLGIRVMVRTGDTTQSEKAKMLKNPPHILITTPESLNILLTSKKFSENLKGVEWCIIDEIHSLAENKRGSDTSMALERLDMSTSHLTRVGLSATVSPIEEIANYLVGFEGDKPRDCKIVEVKFIKELDIKVISPVDDMINTPHAKMHDALYKQIDQLIQEHKTTLIFTNTRSATERVVNNLKEKFPENYLENIGAHHSSLSKEHRKDIERKLREGLLKVVVCSTSLELGIDIGYIDLVICLSSPKSVARFLQRAGRAGHKLHEKVKARLIVMDRDDLVECSLILKAAKEGRIDKIYIPKNPLDLLAQHVLGIVLQRSLTLDELYGIVRRSYTFHTLDKVDFINIVEYLAGEYTSLEERHVYARIWYNKDTGILNRRGWMTRVIYMTNIGTIPDESYIRVKLSSGAVVGKIEESFLERLRPGDIFVLGGKKYKFLYSRGMSATVKESFESPPNIPAWFSEMLPLSFDLAVSIGKFRRLLSEMLEMKEDKEAILRFIEGYLYVEGNTAKAIYNYFREQYLFDRIPTDKRIVIENYHDGDKKYVIFHTLFGRRVNGCLSRIMAYILAKQQRRDVEVGVTDNGFYILSKREFNTMKAFKVLRPSEMEMILSRAIDKSEILKRRFRHCAARSLMILREYKGQRKGVSRQQISSQILLNAVKKISDDFPVLKEARREVMKDSMNFDQTLWVLKSIEEGKIKVVESFTGIPSPFALNMIAESHKDLIKIEAKQEFMKRMHDMIMAKIYLKEGRKKSLS